LNLACTPSEVMVFIGAEMCRVNSLDVNTLYCTPPVNQPQALDSYGLRRGGLPIVKVCILKALHCFRAFNCNYLRFDRFIVIDITYVSNQ